jgi:cell division protein ZapA
MSQVQRDTVVITLLGKEYRIVCPPDEIEMLHKSADELQQRMQAIYDSGKVIGTDRIAVMAALNLAHDLLSQTPVADTSPVADTRIRAMQADIAAVLGDKDNHT